jgi:hypothetical protein
MAIVMEAPPPSLPVIEAVEILGTRDLADARRLARLQLSLARSCPVCRVLIRHVAVQEAELRPRELIDRLAPWERDEHSVRLAAAWIVLHAW